MKDLAKILSYFVAVIFVGALLAPPLYWGGQALAQRGILPFLGETEFQKFFNRAALLAALALMWPAVRALRMQGVRELGLEPDPLRIRHLLTGWMVAAAVVAIMSGAYWALNFYHFKDELPWDRLPKIFLTSVVVAFLEEWLFRGAIFGLFRRTMRPYHALFWVTALFAALHFIKPQEDFDPGPITWLSGFTLIPHVFYQFSDPPALLAGFSTLFVLGWVLGYATLRTRSLWMSIGFHAGVVFVKMGFAKLTKRESMLLPWVGKELQIGLVPLCMLALGGVVLWAILRRGVEAALSARADVPPVTSFDDRI